MYGHHHPPDRLTATERTMLFFLISQLSALNGGAKTVREIAAALGKSSPEVRRILENLGMRLPLTHRPWRLRRDRPGLAPARWSIVKHGGQRGPFLTGWDEEMGEPGEKEG